MTPLTPQQRVVAASPEAQNVARFAAFVISRRFPKADSDELRALANEGLVLAARRFNPGRGVLFSTFARKRVIGHLLRNLQHETRYQAANTPFDDVLSSHSSAAPSSADAHADTPEEARDRLIVHMSGRFELLTVAALVAQTPEELAISHQEWHLTRDALQDGRASLPGDQAHLIQRYFYDRASLTTIGKELRCSRQTAGRILKRATSQLWQFMAHRLDDWPCPPDRPPRDAPTPQANVGEL